VRFRFKINFPKLFKLLKRTKPQPRLDVKDTDGNLIFTRPWPCLVGRDLSNQIFINADFVGQDLSDVNFRGTKLIGCKLNGAKLRHSDLRGAILNFCDLSNADLTGARVNQADLLNTSFGNRASRTEMRHVEGLSEALIDPRELVHRGRFNTLRGLRGESKDVRLSPTVREARIKACAEQPLRPRCLLLLGDPMGLGVHGQYQRAPKIRKQPQWLVDAVSAVREKRLKESAKRPEATA